MARRKLENKNIRKLIGISRSIAVTLPIGFVRKLKWRKKQKVVLKLSGKKIFIEDWKK
jgi:hypothetical protein